MKVLTPAEAAGAEDAPIHVMAMTVRELAECIHSPITVVRVLLASNTLATLAQRFEMPPSPTLRQWVVALEGYATEWVVSAKVAIGMKP